MGVLSVAENLLAHGYQPVVIDGGVQDIKESLTRINLQDFLYAGISTWSGPQILQGIEAVKYIRQINPALPIVWGGIHASLLPEQTAQSPWVDIVVRGESERTFPQLLNRLQLNKSYADIRGLSYRKNGAIINTADQEFIDLDSKNILPYNLLDCNKYAFKYLLQIPTSRGCPNRCIFCYNLAYIY